MLAASVASIAAVIPYVMTLEADILKKVKLPMPIWELLILQMAENTLLFAVLIIAGLYFARQMGLGLPMLESALRGEPFGREARKTIAVSVVIGVLVAGFVAAADIAFGIAGVSIKSPNASPPAWQGFLAAFYGGIAEEIVFRLFLMTLIAWGLRLIKRMLDRSPSSAEMWLAISISAVLFGLGHLPATAALTELTGTIVLRAIILNGIYGLVAGWLYWKKGLESAMVAHFTGDLVLHVLVPLLM